MELAEVGGAAVGNDWVITLRRRPLLRRQAGHHRRRRLHLRGAARPGGRRRRRRASARSLQRGRAHQSSRSLTPTQIVAAVAPPRALHHRPRLRHPASSPPRRRRRRRTAAARRRRLRARGARTARPGTCARNPYFYGGKPPTEAAHLQDHPRRQLAPPGAGGRLRRPDPEHHLAAAPRRGGGSSPSSCVETGRSSVSSYLGFNCEDPIFKDVRVRQRDRPAPSIARRIIHTKLHDRAVAGDGDAADVPLGLRKGRRHLRLRSGARQAAPRRGGLSRSRRRRAVPRFTSSTRPRPTSSASPSRDGDRVSMLAQVGIERRAARRTSSRPSSPT